MAQVRVFSSGFGSGETKVEDQELMKISPLKEHISVPVVQFLRRVRSRIYYNLFEMNESDENTEHRLNFYPAVNTLTRIEVSGAAGRVFQHWDADVLEVFSPLCEALALQTASPENQLTLEQVLHQIQAVCVGE